DRAGKTRACLTAGPNQPEHKKTDTPRDVNRLGQPGLFFMRVPACLNQFFISASHISNIWSLIMATFALCETRLH
ncbi:hypothetical protein, partial [Pseudomonas sp. BDAL1]